MHELQPGTTLTATITTTTAPVTRRQRTVTNLTWKVWYVAGNTVILTLPDGTNKQYKATPDMKFDVGGQEATVFDLKKRMQISAQKIVEEPMTEVTSNTAVTGHAPKPVVAQAPAPVTSAVRKAAAPAPVAVAALPARLPKTESPLPLAGMIGLLFTGAGLGLRMLRRS